MNWNLRVPREKTMKRIILMLVSTMMLSGCAALTQSSYCEGPRANRVQIHYGDSELTVTPRIANVHQTGDFVLKLMPRKRSDDPDGVDYNTVEVTVVGKTADDKVWILEKTESYDSAEDHQIVYCVPENQELKVYEYEVTVAEVGKLDPRARVNQ